MANSELKRTIRALLIQTLTPVIHRYARDSGLTVTEVCESIRHATYVIEHTEPTDS